MEQTKQQTKKLTNSTKIDFKRLLLDKEILIRRKAELLKNTQIELYILNGERKQLQELIEASKKEQ